MSRSKETVLAALVLLLAAHVSAQQTVQKFIRETPYLLYLPQQYDANPSKTWPLLMFLHGSGERGTDVEKVKQHGPPMLIEKGKQFPFIVVSPQAPEGRAWDAALLKELLADVQKKYRVDDDRIYLTGLSMGGYGTWDFAMSSPQLFAAIAPICGGGDASRAWRLKNIPVWCFHGAKDYVVPLDASQRMIDAVKPINKNVKFTIYPETGHDSWVEAYNNDSLYTWLLSQKRYRHRPVPVAENVLKTYEGAYAGQNTDTVTIVLENGKLVAGSRKGKIELKPGADNIFFFDEKAFDHMEFTRKPDGTPAELILVGDRRQPFKKVR